MGGVWAFTLGPVGTGTWGWDGGGRGAAGCLFTAGEFWPAWGAGFRGATLLGPVFCCSMIRVLSWAAFSSARLSDWVFQKKSPAARTPIRDQGQETLGGEPGFSPGRRGGSRLFSLWEAGQPFHDSAKHGKNPFLGEKWSRTDQSVRQRILYRFEGKNTTELPTYIWPFPRTLHFVL